MNARDLMLVPLLVCTGFTVVAYAISILVKRDTASLVDKSMRLAQKHRENMASDDPAVVADAKDRWRRMCMHLAGMRNGGHIALALMDIGDEIEREAGK